MNKAELTEREGTDVNMVLVIGERPEQATALAQNLGLLGLNTIASARELNLAVRSLVAHNVSLIVLDADACESLDFFRTLKDLSDLPILVRGPMDDTDLVISYLEAGAADYVGRKTPRDVLAAKAQSMLRAFSANGDASHVIVAGDLEIDLRERRVMKGRREVSLTPLEFRLLNVLAENLNRPCTREQLLVNVWGEDFSACSHYLRLYIGYLRQKIEDHPRRPRLILNVWGYGYRLAEPKRKRAAVRSRAEVGVAAG